MDPLLKKLQYKEESSILVLSPPVEFGQTLKVWEAEYPILVDATALDDVSFVLSFVRSAEQVGQIMDQISDKLVHDAKLWFAYPKGSSKKYKVDISRDHGWDAVNRLGYRGIRAVSIDSDWSATRFRENELVKSRK